MLEISYVKLFENFSKQLNFMSKKTADLLWRKLAPPPGQQLCKRGGTYTKLYKLCQRGGAYTELHKLCQRGGAYTVAYIMPKGEELIHSCTNHTKGAGLNMRVLPSIVQF